MKIVILDGYSVHAQDLDWDLLRPLGELTVYDRTPADQVIPRMQGAEIVLTNKCRITREVLAACPELRYLGELATGYNNIDIAAAKEQGVTFVQTSMEMDSDEYVDNIIINTDQSNAALVRMAGEACINDSIPEDGRILGNLSNDINIINSWGTTLDDSVKSEVDALYESIRKGEIEMPEKVAE